MRRLVSFMAALLLLLPAQAYAFCGFYVGGAGQEMFNNASVVIMMRDGTRTVLSMQNDYQGPAEDFALVVPVPVVLGEDDVKVLPKDIFARVDTLAAPRLVEYWEEDPCAIRVEYDTRRDEDDKDYDSDDDGNAAPEDYGVTVEAEFAVGEFDIVILSAKDSGGLEDWLVDNSYAIPEGSDAALSPYVANEMKFFVAKVAKDRVEFNEDGGVVLSPLRFHFDSETFELPIRLGMLNSDGEQSLIVHILAPNQRYEVANRPNAFIPTNLVVRDETREDFAAFYKGLMAQTLAETPGAVITEYAWSASSCDPCPGPPMAASDIVTLGADVLPAYADQVAKGEVDQWAFNDFVLTRLHYRYEADLDAEDLVFTTAEPVIGGRGTPDTEGKMYETGAESAYSNQFQGRYIILHPWVGEITCDDPYFGVWGGPPDGSSQLRAAEGMAFKEYAEVDVDDYVIEDSVSYVDAVRKGETPDAPPTPRVPSPRPPEQESTAPSSDDDAGAAPGTSTPPERGAGVPLWLMIGVACMAFFALVVRAARREGASA